MPVPILPIQPISPAAAPIAPAASTSSPGAFGSVLNQAIQQVESFQTNADQSINRFLNGEGEEIHKVAIAAQEADLSFQLFIQMRNKVVTAYQQIMQMQV